MTGSGNVHRESAIIGVQSGAATATSFACHEGAGATFVSTATRLRFIP